MKRKSEVQFENLRNVEKSFADLSSKTQKQVKFLLKQQQEQTLAQATQDEESILHDMEVIDVVEGDRAIYQLFLWDTDGSLLVADKTQEVGVVVQHGFQMREPDPALHMKLAAAWVGAAKRLRTKNDFTFGEPEPPKANVAGSIDDTIAEFERRYASKDPKETVNGFGLLHDDAFHLVRDRSGGWRPLPVRRPDDVSDDVKKVFRFLLGTKIDGSLMWTCGYPRDNRWGRNALTRFLGDEGRSAIDATVTIDGAKHPLWCLVSDALYDIRTPKSVLDLFFAQRSESELAGAWRELVSERPHSSHRERPRESHQR